MGYAEPSPGSRHQKGVTLIRRRTVSLAALLAAVALGVLVASAAALTPPAGTPDLSAMAIQPGDLAPGAKLAAASYLQAPRNFAALYERKYASAMTTSGTALLGLDSQVLLGDNVGATRGLFSLERSLYRTKRGRVLLAKQVASQSSKEGVKVKISGFGKFRALSIGTQSFVQPITLKAGDRSAAAEYVVVRDGSVLANLTVGLLAPKQTLAVAHLLGGDVASHIAAVLAGSGSTGASGTTGTTGASGSTGATG
jgi:hypothetical protein